MKKNVKKKVKRFVPTLLVALLFAGTMTYAAQTYDYYMSPGQTQYTPLIQKTSTTTQATVVKGGTAADYTYARFTVVNDRLYAKSETKKLYGITQNVLSYAGYNVQQGDFVRLKIENNTSDNSGRFITVKGTWYP